MDQQISTRKIIGQNNSQPITDEVIYTEPYYTIIEKYTAMAPYTGYKGTMFELYISLKLFLSTLKDKQFIDNG